MNKTEKFYNEIKDYIYLKDSELNNLLYKYNLDIDILKQFMEEWFPGRDKNMNLEWWRN